MIIPLFGFIISAVLSFIIYNDHTLADGSYLWMSAFACGLICFNGIILRHEEKIVWLKLTTACAVGFAVKPYFLFIGGLLSPKIDLLLVDHALATLHIFLVCFIAGLGGKVLSYIPINLFRLQTTSTLKGGYEDEN